MLQRLTWIRQSDEAETPEEKGRGPADLLELRTDVATGPSVSLREQREQNPGAPPSLCRLRVPDVPMQAPLPVCLLPHHDILRNGSAGSESQVCLTDLMGHLAGHLEIDRPIPA
jgi:hypothetical protein